MAILRASIAPGAGTFALSGSAEAVHLEIGKPNEEDAVKVLQGQHREFLTQPRL
jgi:hypothetical protein